MLSLYREYIEMTPEDEKRIRNGVNSPADFFGYRDVELLLAALDEARDGVGRWTAKCNEIETLLTAENDRLKAELERVKQERDDFKRKGKELCCAHGSTLVEIHDLQLTLSRKTKALEVAKSALWMAVHKMNSWSASEALTQITEAEKEPNMGIETLKPSVLDVLKRYTCKQLGINHEVSAEVVVREIEKDKTALNFTPLQQAERENFVRLLHEELGITGTDKSLRQGIGDLKAALSRTRKALEVAKKALAVIVHRLNSWDAEYALNEIAEITEAEKESKCEADVPFCSQCGQSITAFSCGPTHGLLKHEYKQKREFQGDGVDSQRIKIMAEPSFSRTDTCVTIHITHGDGHVNTQIYTPEQGRYVRDVLNEIYPKE